MNDIVVVAKLQLLDFYFNLIFINFIFLLFNQTCFDGYLKSFNSSVDEDFVLSVLNIFSTVGRLGRRDIVTNLTIL